MRRGMRRSSLGITALVLVKEQLTEESKSLLITKRFQTSVNTVTLQTTLCVTNQLEACPLSQKLMTYQSLR